MDPKAPLTNLSLMNMQGSLRFTKDGNWLHDGEPVTHSGISDYFSNHLSFSVEFGSYVLSDGTRCLRVEVEDTEVVIRTLLGGEDLGWDAVLSGGTIEKFAEDSLSVSPEGVWYCRVRKGTVKARLLSAAIQHLFSSIEESDGAYILRVRGKKFKIQNEK